MRLGLVAHRYHAAVAHMYLELCAAAGVEVVLYTSEAIHRQLRQFAGDLPVRAARAVFVGEMGSADFLRLVAQESGSLDALLFVELQFEKRFIWDEFAGLDFRCPVHCGLHDILRDTGLEPFPFWRRDARSQRRQRQRVVNGKIAGFVVHSEPMRDRFARIAAPRPVIFLPVYFRDARFRRRTGGEGPLRLCVTGAYSELLKEYESTLRAVDRVLERGVDVRLTLAGRHLRHEYRRLHDLFSEFEQRCPGVLSRWQDYMDESLFRDALESADICIAPVVRRPPWFEYGLRGRPQRRTYALDTHITAATYDAIRFQLPIVYPSYYMPEAKKHPGALTFASWGALVDLLHGLARDRSRLDALTADMIRYAAEFTPDRFVAPFKALLSA